MFRTLHLLWIPVVVCGLACMATSKEITDPAEAKADPDFSIQGEYIGEVSHEGETHKLGAQVIARGKGKFEVVLSKGGLPGDGWKHGEPSLKMQGTAAELKGRWPDSDRELAGKIADGKLTVSDTDGKPFVLTRTQRKSPTLGAKPPAGAVVIFDGSNLDKFEPVEGHLTEDKLLVSGVLAKPDYNNYKLHLEFRLSWMPEARGQGRSNSGVYVHNAYEIQVLDSFGLEGRNNECGGFYSIKDPDVNMCLPPMTWQTYDIDFTAPKYEGDKKVSNARITLRHNGVAIHDDFELPRATPGGQGEGPGPRGIQLQGHGNKVMYRNIWLEKK